MWSGNDPDLGPFSRDNTNHDFVPYEIAYPAIGPFDPLRPNSSFLPDGMLDPGDANMPALRVDLDTTGTIGALTKADKSDVYSLNGTRRERWRCRAQPVRTVLQGVHPGRESQRHVRCRRARSGTTSRAS